MTADRAKSIPVLGGPEIKLGIRCCHMYLWQPPSLCRCHLHREGSDAATTAQGCAAWGPALCTQLPVLEEDLCGEWEQEPFRSSLPAPCTAFLPSPSVCPVAQPGLYTITVSSPATQSPDCSMAVMEGSLLSIQSSVATKVFLFTFPQCFFCC